jgi:hypothetical protein
MNLTGISRPRSSSFLLCYLSQPKIGSIKQHAAHEKYTLQCNAAGMQLCGRDAEKHACCDTRSAWARDSMRAAWVCDEKAQVMDGYPVDHLPVEFRPLPRRGMSLLVFRLPLASTWKGEWIEGLMFPAARVLLTAGINEVIRQQQFAATISLLSHTSASPPRPRNSSMLIRCRPLFLRLAASRRVK